MECDYSGGQSRQSETYVASHRRSVWMRRLGERVSMRHSVKGISHV